METNRLTSIQKEEDTASVRPFSFLVEKRRARRPLLTREHELPTGRKARPHLHDTTAISIIYYATASP